jgi:hypothetical protein
MSQVRLIAILAAVWLAAVFPVSSAPLVAQSQPASALPPKGFKPFTDPNQRFSLAYPDRWKPVAGARDLLLTIASGDLKAVVVIEQQQIPFAITEITERFMGLEVESLKNRQPNTTDVATMVAKNRPTAMVIDYSRTGINGSERLRQFSIYEGTVVLRITCIAPTKEFEKNAALFEAIASSVKITARQGGGSPGEQR